MQELRRDPEAAGDAFISNDFFFPVLFGAIASILALACFYDRRYILKSHFPEVRLRLTDVLGHVKSIPTSDLFRRLQPWNVYLLQILRGYSKIFANEKYFTFWMSWKPIIVLHKAEAVEQLLGSTSTLEKAWFYKILHPWLGTGLLTSKSQKWKSRRKLITPAFHFEILKDFLPVLSKQSCVLVDILKGETSKKWIDIVHIISLCSLDIICETTLGSCIEVQKNSESEYVQAVLRASNIIMARMINPFLSYDWIFFNTAQGRQFKKDLCTLHGFTRSVIQTKRAELVKDEKEGVQRESKRMALLDLLLDQQMRFGNLTEDDINEEINTFAFEGHDTTSMGISWTLYLLGLHRDIQDKVQEELDAHIPYADFDMTKDNLSSLKYMECVIKESLRLYPPVSMFGREMHKDTHIDGKLIPKGDVCSVLAFMLHRDASVFPNPEVFDPNRFTPESSVGRHPYAYVPFAAGPRNCIGQRFAMMEMKTVLAHVLKNFDVTSIEPRDKVEIAMDIILRSVYPLKIKLSERTII